MIYNFKTSFLSFKLWTCSDRNSLNEEVWIGKYLSTNSMREHQQSQATGIHFSEYPPDLADNEVEEADDAVEDDEDDGAAAVGEVRGLGVSTFSRRIRRRWPVGVTSYT
jgi:hypothetical protein